MPKTYFCKTIHDYEMCGETNPINFEPGRYSACRSCRNKKNKENKEKNFSILTEERNNKIDPSSNLRHLIEDTILRIPIMDGYNIIEKFRTDNEEVSNIVLMSKKNLEDINKRLEYLEKYTKLLELKIDTTKK
jgi:hypothetical protein